MTSILDSLSQRLNDCLMTMKGTCLGIDVLIKLLKVSEINVENIVSAQDVIDALSHIKSNIWQQIVEAEQ